ncbi:peptidase [Thioclava dalianensis]|uniref:ATP-dependent Clp protease proteolytic subunit n=1 Tax=Thioclava dalianensis TaxID=1185766 RepID=A0A074T9D4_9RHOB|nr:head maturation protease, ClpP-related [Thioclava dalianensis]KEP68411.1 peptidase [Thioclava dalianensis]SFN62471.1 ATP-dependent protease ClpP, protease subunit [Thioclava dalianensis]
MTMRTLPKATVPVHPGVKSHVGEVAAKRWNPDIRAAANAADPERTISVLDVIGADVWGDGVTAKRISGALRAMGDGPVTVNINSPGGDFFEGLAIYNQLREHKGEVTVRVLGMAASAASVIVMAGDQILMARASFLMIHNTWVLAAGDRHAFREVADWLEPFDEAAVSIYAARTGIDAKALAAMLDKETWIGGDSAVDQGFADDLLSSDQIDAAPSNSVEPGLAALKKLDMLLANGVRATKSERRELLAAAKGGKSGAAPTGMSGAAVSDWAQGALNKLQTL